MMLSTVARCMNEIRAECSSVKDQCYHMIVFTLSPSTAEGRVQLRSPVCVRVCTCMCVSWNTKPDH